MKKKTVITIGAIVGVLLLVCCAIGVIFLSSGDTLTETKTQATEIVSTEGEQPEEEVEVADTPQPTNTPQAIGTSRSNPYPRSEVVVAPNWDVQVLETVRGDQAWQALQAANEFNEPAPEGMEYLIVKLHVKCTYDDNEEHSISGGDFSVTGDRFIEYSGAAAVEPDPPLDARLFKDGETEGWSAYLIGQGEGNLILIVDELLSFDDDRRRFIALDDGASITVAPELSQIEPTELGVNRNDPAPFGEMVTTEDWKVRLLEAKRGDDAWTMVQEANQFNEPPAEGMEYVVAKVYVRYISTKDQPNQIGGSYFETTGSANELYDLPSIVDPAPQLDVTLFPGGEFEGWITFQVAQGETNTVVVFEPLFSLSSKNKRFLSLEP